MAKKRTSRRRTSTYNVKCTMKDSMKCHGTGGAIYGLGFLGALVYYITTAPTFWDAVVGFVKAILWPAFLVHGALMALGL